MIYLVDEKLVNGKIPPTLELKGLNEENNKHLKALRPDLEEEVAFLNLRGQAAVYQVINNKPLLLQFKEKVIVEEPAVKTHLYLAPPSDSALEQAIEQATEVGFDSIHFIRTERVQLPKGKSLPFARLRRVVQSSCKQCGRWWAPEIHEDFNSFSRVLDKTDGHLRICADEGAAKNSWGSLQGILDKDKKDISIFIGPEGGWSEAERKALHSTAHIFSLGPHVLRVPTAVVSAYALTWKELSSG